VTFRSLKDTCAWVVANMDPSQFMLFPDAHSLSNIGPDEASTNTEVLFFEASSLKSGFKSSFEALVMASFKLELPPFFGAEAKNTGTVKSS